MRISRDEWAMEMAKLTATRSTCLRRHVGCVLLNCRGHVLATGFNGVAAGQPHCNEAKKMPVYHSDSRVIDLGDSWEFGKATFVKFPQKFLDQPGNAQCVGFDEVYPYACSGAKAPSGTNLDGCQAIHAEQNALLQCKNVYELDACYVTASPCMTCTKLLLNTSCQKIIFLEEYPHTEAKKLWESAGRQWEQFSK